MSESRKERRQKKESSKKRRSGWGCVGIVILLIIVAMGLLIWKVYSDVRNTTDAIHNPVDYEQVRKPQGVLDERESFSILLLGIDTGEYGRTEQGRSDTMMMVTVNAQDNRSTIFSIPRDTYVEIPGYGMDKINHAYAYGDASLSIETVQNLFQVPVDYYVSVNMQGLEDIINVLGGITITPTVSFSQDGYTFVEGQPITVDGEGALAYSRNRYDDPSGDYGRQARQRQIIITAVQEIASFSTIANFQGVLGTLEDNVETNASFDEMLSMFNNYLGAIDQIEEYQLSGTGDNLNGVYYDFLSDEALYEVRTIMQEELQYTPGTETGQTETE